MRKSVFIFVFIIFASILLAGTGTAAAESADSRIILYTYFWQIGEDDRLVIGTLDENGMLRTLSGIFSEMNWPAQVAEQLEYLSHTEKFEIKGNLSSQERFAIKSLIYEVQPQEGKAVYTGILDGGTEESYAIDYSIEGEPEFILLGKSGQELFENTDPNAQALYLRLRTLFPDVPNDAYDPGLGPEGFKPVPLTEFLGFDTETLISAELEAFYNDCEEGNIPVEMTAEVKTKIQTLVRSGIVTGKADCIISTGGISVYTFRSSDGTFLGEIDLEDGLLVTNDGRYYVDVP